MNDDLSAPSVVILLRLWLRFSDAGKNIAAIFWPPKSVLPHDSRSCDCHWDGTLLAIAILPRFFKEKNVPTAVWLATGTLATENCSYLRLQFLVRSDDDCSTWCSAICKQRSQAKKWLDLLETLCHLSDIEEARQAVLMFFLPDGSRVQVSKALS